jgi:tetratricopeptide (TPR) repeat protein
MTGTVIGVAGMLAGPAVLFLIPGLEGSIGARVTIWRATLSLIVTRPVLGHGPEILGQVFTTVFPPELVYLQGRGVLVDRAHNLFLDTLVSTGVVGLLAYTTLVGATLVAVVRALVRDPNHRMNVIKVAGLAAAVGHLVETQYSFSVTTTAVLFWITMGTLVASRRETLTRLVPDSSEVTKIRWPRRFLAVTLLLTVLPTSVVFLTADTRAGDADRTSTLSDLHHSIAAAGRATALWPSQPVYHKHLSWLHLQRARRGHDSPAEFRAAEAALDTAQELTPGDYLVWAGYGELYVAWGQTGDLARFIKAEGAYRQAVALFPGSAMLHTGWGLVYVAQGRLAEAEVQFHQAAALDHTDAWAYTYLGDVLLVRGDLTGAEEAYHNALRWAPDIIGAQRGLGHIYRHRGWIEGALIAYQSALDLAPNDRDLHLDVALCHWNLGQRELACQIAERGLQVAPQHPDLLDLHSECIK